MIRDRFKTHALAVAIPEESIVGNVQMGTVMVSQGTVRGSLVPTDSGTVLERFGVETTNGWEFYCDSDDASKFAVGGECTYDGRTFKVIAPPRTFSGYGSADHTAIALEEAD